MRRNAIVARPNNNNNSKSEHDRPINGMRSKCKRSERSIPRRQAVTSDTDDGIKPLCNCFSIVSASFGLNDNPVRHYRVGGA